ncbi:hypothetical protein AB835_13445 [Candidatus Endobugula sertula]|uniref:Filamentous haemagglutinin FhaB/tRNA nuclease CdiA-like TPS domain-containing protein n=1 Tax=Candidatus Endobugula sertula TaxID=62101 RepID=A0A1D2QLX8_9GAMM|nr:hypothetical protein AB835_13445 [Candidatus Endobugula sertula]
MVNNTGIVRRHNIIAPASNNSLFVQNSAPTATYLVETDPRFTNNRQWLSSAYVTQQLIQSPAITDKRLGDGFYEQRLVREQIVALTGRRFLDNYSNDETQYQALLDAGVAYAKQYNLQPGISLSEAHMANITTPLVWLEVQTVQLPDGSSQQVLVPKLYAVVQDNDLLPSGALLSGDSIALKGDHIVNSGDLVARTRVDIDGGRLSDMGGRLQAAEAFVDVNNDAVFEASDWRTTDTLDITAGRDVIVRSRASTNRWDNEQGSSSRTELAQTSRLQVTGDSGQLNINAGRDLTVTAAEIDNQGTGDTRLVAGNNLTLDTLTETQQYSHANGDETLTNEITSRIHGAGNITLQADNTLVARGANVEAGQALSMAAKDIELTTAENRLNSDLQTPSYIRKVEQLTHQGIELRAGTDLSLTATNNLTATGTTATAGNNLALNAGGDIDIRVAQDEAYRFEYREQKKSFGRKTTELKESYQTTNVGGEFEAGNNLTINSTINNDGSVTTNNSSGDITIIGSDLKAEQQVAIAGDNVTIADQKEVSFTREETFKRGFGGLSSKSSVQTSRTTLTDGSEVSANTQDPEGNTVVRNSDTETYFRVEGGGSGNATSQHRITANTDGSISINPGCSGQLCVSVGNSDHATYFLTNKRADGSVVVFEVDAKLHKEIMDSAVPQRPIPGVPRNPDAPQIVDPNQPGTAIQLPKVWESLLENNSSNARVLTQDEFLKEFK